MKGPPWMSVASMGTFPREEGTFSFAEYAERNPCLTCQTSPCCWYLHLESVRPREFRHFDYLRFLLNFDDIEILVAPNGSWGVYLRRPCRNLDQGTALCTVRGTERHPQVCKTFNPYSCFYKKVVAGWDPASGHVRLDRERLARVVARARFDALGRATRVPTAAEARQIVDEDGSSGPSPAPELAVASGDEAGRVRADLSGSRCGDCTAACCRLLAFGRSIPRTEADIDALRYAMGFPGVMLSLGADSVRVVVRTSCRHLASDGRTCSVFGSVQRPKVCEYLDETRCDVRERFVTERGRSAIVEGLDEFERFLRGVEIGNDGVVERFPGADWWRAVKPELTEV